MRSSLTCFFMATLCGNSDPCVMTPIIVQWPQPPCDDSNRFTMTPTTLRWFQPLCNYSNHFAMTPTTVRWLRPLCENRIVSLGLYIFTHTPVRELQNARYWIKITAAILGVFNPYPHTPALTRTFAVVWGPCSGVMPGLRPIALYRDGPPNPSLNSHGYCRKSVALEWVDFERRPAGINTSKKNNNRRFFLD